MYFIKKSANISSKPETVSCSDIAPYVSRSSVASASYSFEGIVDENKNITNEKKRKMAEMRAQFRFLVASCK